jgi:SNF2 family DNA or RNA helicase
MANKLLQMSNGAIYDSEKNTHELHRLKIDALKEMIEDNPTENFLVAYNFKSDLQRLLKEFPHAKVLGKTGEEVSEWNKGNIKLLLAQPQSASMGLNLQFGGSCVIWFGMNWSLELYQQFNARLNRQGQEKPVRIIHILAKGCIDERVLKVLEGKAKTQDALMEGLKFSLTEK